VQVQRCRFAEVQRCRGAVVCSSSTVVQRCRGDAEEGRGDAEVIRGDAEVVQRGLPQHTAVADMQTCRCRHAGGRCIGAEVQRCSQWCRGAVRGVGCRGAELQRGTEVEVYRGVQRCSEVKRCRCRCKGRGVEEVQKCAAILHRLCREAEMQPWCGGGAEVTCSRCRIQQVVSSMCSSRCRSR